VVNAGNLSDGAGQSTSAFVSMFPCPWVPQVNKMEGMREDITDSVTAGVCSPDKAHSRTTAVGMLIDGV
jgi:hypothetical protein